MNLLLLIGYLLLGGCSAAIYLYRFCDDDDIGLAIPVFLYWPIAISFLVLSHISSRIVNLGRQRRKRDELLESELRNWLQPKLDNSEDRK